MATITGFAVLAKRPEIKQFQNGTVVAEAPVYLNDYVPGVGYIKKSAIAQFIGPEANKIINFANSHKKKDGTFTGGVGMPVFIAGYPSTSSFVRNNQTIYTERLHVFFTSYNKVPIISSVGIVGSPIKKKIVNTQNGPQVVAELFVFFNGYIPSAQKQNLNTFVTFWGEKAEWILSKANLHTNKDNQPTGGKGMVLDISCAVYTDTFENREGVSVSLTKSVGLDVKFASSAFVRNKNENNYNQNNQHQHQNNNYNQNNQYQQNNYNQQPNNNYNQNNQYQQQNNNYNQNNQYQQRNNNYNQQPNNNYNQNNQYQQQNNNYNQNNQYQQRNNNYNENNQHQQQHQNNQYQQNKKNDFKEEVSNYLSKDNVAPFDKIDKNASMPEVEFPKPDIPVDFLVSENENIADILPSNTDYLSELSISKNDPSTSLSKEGQNSSDSVLTNSSSVSVMEKTETFAIPKIESPTSAEASSTDEVIFKKPSSATEKKESNEITSDSVIDLNDSSKSALSTLSSFFSSYDKG